MPSRQPFETILDEHMVPPADRVVVQQQGSGELFATPARIQENQGIGPPRSAMRRWSILRQGDQISAINGRQKAGANHSVSRIQISPLDKPFFALRMNRGIVEFKAFWTGDAIPDRPDD
jgi:hypothetical protein